MPKISVIIPLYNCQKYILSALESVKSQTFDDFEAIIIDDNSTDDSFQIASNFICGDKRFIIYKNEENKGLSFVRNRGLALSTTDIIFFLDSDDAIAPNCFEVLHKTFVEQCAEIVLSDYTRNHDDFNKTDNVTQEIYTNDQIMFEVCKCEKIQNFLWGRLIKKSLFNDLKFPEGRTFEDVPIMCKLFSKCNKVIFVNSPLYFYRTNLNSISKTMTPKKLNDFFDSMLEKANFIEAHYPQYLSMMCQSFFELFYLRKELSISKKSLTNYIVLKKIYKKSVKNCKLKQRLKYIIAV